MVVEQPVTHRARVINIAPKRIVTQRKKLSHAGPKTANREAELTAPTGVGSGDLLDHLVSISKKSFNPKRVSGGFRLMQNALKLLQVTNQIDVVVLVFDDLLSLAAKVRR